MMTMILCFQLKCNLHLKVKKDQKNEKEENVYLDMDLIAPESENEEDVKKESKGYCS